MKKINLYIFILILLFPSVCMKGQENMTNEITADQYQILKTGDSIKIMLNLKLDEMHLGSQEMVTVTPVVRSADRSMFYEFDPIVITGAKRNKALNRSIGFGNFEFQKEPQLIERRYNNKPQNIPLVLTLPYSEWLHEADLMLIEDLTGCACEAKGNREYDIADILPPLFIPQYMVSYVTPPVEEVKRRSETYSARINFEVNKYQILENFKNNAQVLEEVDIIITEIRNDPNLTVNEFTITGYASPEGNYQHNMTLSKNRAQSFVVYLRNKYNIGTGSIKTDWKGEDWDGLRKAVELSYITGKESVLSILDNETNIDARKSKLKQLSGGETYRLLLNEYYPPLRRNDYTISYIAKPFSVEEAKETIKRKPKYLSENEIFLVANTYPKDSKEFKEVFDIAAKVYPDNKYTQLNIMALNMEQNMWDKVSIQNLQTMDIPEAWNNLGIWYVKQSEYEKADAFFTKAANAGVKEAALNKEQLAKFRANGIPTDTIDQY